MGREPGRGTPPRYLEQGFKPTIRSVDRPARWLLAQGQQLLQQGISLDPDHVVYDALPRMAGGHPREVVQVLRLMIVTAPEAWSVLGSVDDVRETLGTVLGSGDEHAHADAIIVLNLLGARGMSQFRDLMPTTG